MAYQDQCYCYLAEREKVRGRKKAYDLEGKRKITQTQWVEDQRT